MEDAVLQALESRAKGTSRPLLDSADPVESALAARAGISVTTSGGPPGRRRQNTREQRGSEIMRRATRAGAFPELAEPTADFDPLEAQLQGHSDAAKLLLGAPEMALSGVTGTAGTLADVATLADPGTHDWAYRPRTGPGQFTAESVSELMQPPMAAISGGYDKLFGTGPLAQTFKERGAQAAEAVGAVAGVGQGVRAALRGPVTPDASPSQGGFARENMGAAAADVDLSRLSPELRQEFEAAKAAGAPINRQAAQRLVDADTLPVPMRLTEGQATGDPSKIAGEINRRGMSHERGKFFQDQNQQLIENLDEIRRSAGPAVVHRDHIQNGQALIDAYKGYDAKVTADIDAKYQALRDAAGGDFPVDATALKANIDAALKKGLLSREAPASQMAEIADLAESGSMTFEDFLSLRRNLGNISRTSNDGNTRAAASIMIRELESIPLKGAVADLKPMADAARTAARERFKALEQDPAYRAAVEDGVAVGESSPAADAFVRKYVIGGKAANLEKMNQKFADDPEIGQTITASALNYLRDKARVRGGEGVNFSQAGYNNALKDLEPRIGLLMPEATAELTQQLGRVANTVLHQPRGAAISTSGTTAAFIAEKAAKGAEAVVNMKTGLPLGSYVRGKIDNRRAQKEWLEATKPGAGLTMRDIMSGKYERE